MINEMLKAEGWQSRGWVFIPGYAPIEVGHVQDIKTEYEPPAADVPAVDAVPRVPDA